MVPSEVGNRSCIPESDSTCWPSYPEYYPWFSSKQYIKYILESQSVMVGNLMDHKGGQI